MTQIDPQYLISIIVMAIVGLCCVVVFPVWNKVTSGDGAAGLLGGILAFFVALLIYVFVFWPSWPGQYNEYRQVTGTVQRVGSRFIAGDSGGSTQKFAVQLTTGQTYGCTDTRCSTLRPGQEVTLSCERVWQWNGTPGYDCNFISYGKP